jgi:hypothetical protein
MLFRDFRIAGSATAFQTSRSASGVLANLSLSNGSSFLAASWYTTYCRFLVLFSDAKKGHVNEENKRVYAPRTTLNLSIPGALTGVGGLSAERKVETVIAGGLCRRDRRSHSDDAR